jgi:hypothetical protein
LNTNHIRLFAKSLFQKPGFLEKPGFFPAEKGTLQGIKDATRGSRNDVPEPGASRACFFCDGPGYGEATDPSGHQAWSGVGKGRQVNQGGPGIHRCFAARGKGVRRGSSQFLASNATLRHALSMALAVHWDSENVVRTASWVLNSKAVAQQALAERILWARDAQTPEAERLLDELTSLRQELSKLSTEIPPASQEDAWKKRRQEVAEKERSLSTQLSKHDPRSVRDDPWIDLDEVTRRLPQRSVLVDIARFPVIDFKNSGRKEQPAHYVAWVTRKDGQSYLVDLGESGPIDKLITRARRSWPAPLLA